MSEEITISQQSALIQLRKAAIEIVRYKPNLDFVTWAEINLKNPDGSPFQFRPYQVQPARDLFNPKLESVTLRMFSGAGKTYLIGAAVAYAIAELREQIGVMFPNQDIAEDYVSEELDEFLMNSPVEKLERLTDKMRLKRWRNGSRLDALGANSGGRMRRLQAGVLYADEIDAITQDSSDEGDKLAFFHGRGRERKNVYKWNTSYPSLKGESKIDAIMDQSDLCRWYVDCVHCGQAYEMHRNQMEWDKGSPEKALLKCTNKDCGTPITDKQRRKMSWNGRYLNSKMEDPEPAGRRGFHLGCMSHVSDYDSAFSSYLHYIAAQCEEVEKSSNPGKSLRILVNQKDAESYAEDVEAKAEPETLYDQREDYDPTKVLPAGVLVLTAGVDVQKGRLEIKITGWGENAESWGIRYLVVAGSPQTDKTWEDLDRILEGRYKHPSGVELGIACAAVDSGKWQDTVLNYTRPRSRRNIHAIKGAREIDRKIITKFTKIYGFSKSSKSWARQYPVGTHEAKDLIYQRIELTPNGDGTFPRGFMHFPATRSFQEFSKHAGGNGTGYFEMLLSEDSKMKRSTKTGELIRFFECASGKRNEALDCEVYSMAAERILQPKYSVIASRMNVKDERPD